jgi:hypothetical protein
MNRATRRAMAKAKPMPPPKVVSLPALFDEFTVFDFMETFLQKLKNGYLESVQGVPVFRDNSGELTELCPALMGWIETWEFIFEKIGVNIPMASLRKIHNKLLYNSPLSRAEIYAAEVTNESCKQLFRTSKRKQITEIAKLAQFKILLED